MLLQRCEEKVALRVSGSTRDVIDVSVHRLHVLGELSPDLLVYSPLLVSNFLQGSTQPHAESA
eukprot:80188-Prorocentrum_lima.AAC.1